ncbi:hypothetical protein OUZ56_008531 [Daphnia magna]|uniref:Uncharacterized protein n=1 Tax=Daphnia magna TaxID=35525 RepID=A0ABR0ADM0_9CRUS|nr:hypothetical protein OUZ56_008531 [Daphnia magna]
MSHRRKKNFSNSQRIFKLKKKEKKTNKTTRFGYRMRHFQLTCTRHGIKKQQLLICCVLIPPAPSLFFLAAKRKRKGKKTEQGTTSRPVDLNLETVETNNKNTTTTSKEEDGPNTRMSISLCG